MTLTEVLYGNDEEMPMTSHIVALERWGAYYVTRHVVSVPMARYSCQFSMGWLAVMVTTGVN